MMLGTRSAAAREHFYRWEQRGRGVLVAPEPAELEVQFVPFVHTVDPNVPIDDGKRHTLLSWIASLLSSPPPTPLPPVEEPVRYFPYEIPSLSYITLTFPKDYRPNHTDFEQLLLLLSYCRGIVSFELIATNTAIVFQLVCSTDTETYLVQQLKTLTPPVISTRSESDALELENGLQTAVLDFGLYDEWMRPMAMHKGSDHDPYTALVSVMEYLKAGERCVMQALFSGTVNTWNESTLHSLTDLYGNPLFPDSPEMLPAAKEKLSYPLFAVTVRTVVQAETNARAQQLSDSLATALIHVSQSPVNRLMPLAESDYTFTDRIDDILDRSSRRLGMLLNSRELLTLVHIPAATLPSKKLSRSTHTTTPVPHAILGDDYRLGINSHEGKDVPVSVRTEDRFKHTQIIGGTGTGKSTLLLQLMLQDVEAGNGFAVLDPHGDLIDALIPHIPPDRQHDVILIDPSDTEYPFGLNLLTPGREDENDMLAEDVVSAFRRLSTSWGDQMTTVLYNTLLAFFQNSRTGTLLDLRRFLIEKPFRETWLHTVTDPSIRYYWNHEFPLHKTSSIGPILTRLDAFLRPRQVRYMVAQQKMLDVDSCIAGNKIVLVKLAKGLIGADNSALLGSLIIAKLHQAAFGQQRLAREDRKGFFLYIDEFQNFITHSLTELLSGARKYKLGLILAHQDLQQLRKAESELESAILTNAYTRICFRLAEADAKKLSEGMAGFTPQDFQNLRTGEAIVRIGMPEHSFTLTTVHDTDTPTYDQSYLEQLRARYGTKREDVQAYIESMIQPPPPPPQPYKPAQAPPPPISPAPDPVSAEPVSIPLRTPVEPTTTQTEEVIERKAKRQVVSKHRYLQTLTKKLAESCGYKAILEQPLPDGGRVDVHLEKERIVIACEISVTTPTTWELHNIQKCLAAGYERIFCLSTGPTFLRELKALVSKKISEKEQQKITYLDPSELIDYLMPTRQTQETISKGYKVQVSYNIGNESNQSDKRKAIARIVNQSIRKK